ncbi:YciI family protein [Dactylosporangium sp. CS-033363]|uniref:YciI family protein n=1 Tax=Dactylosporangium sp. CS-033363 TaxID=3239935 RepID=UPI003D94AED9
MKYVVLYTSAPDVAAKAPAHFPAHKARLDAFHARGDLLMVGTFGDPQAQGSMAVFRTRESAEEFAGGDPFVLNGVVAAYEIRDWHEILVP